MALAVTSDARLSWSGASPPPARGKEPKECPERQKEIKMHFLHACWDSVFLHVLEWVLEANLEFQLSLSHLKEVGRDVLTGESCLIGRYNHQMLWTFCPTLMQWSVGHSFLEANLKAKFKHADHCLFQ